MEPQWSTLQKASPFKGINYHMALTKESFVAAVLVAISFYFSYLIYNLSEEAFLLTLPFGMSIGLLTWPKRGRLAGLFLGSIISLSILSAMFHEANPLLIFLLGVAITSLSLFGAKLIRTFFPSSILELSFRQAILLFSSVGPIFSFVTSLSTLFLLSLFGLWDAPFLSSWMTLWMAECLGGLIVTPFIMALLGPKKQKQSLAIITLILPIFFFGALAHLLTVKEMALTGPQVSLEKQLHRTTLSAQKYLEHNIEQLKTLAYYFELNPQMTLEQFHELTSNLIKRSKGVESFQWIPIVRKEDRHQFELQVNTTTVVNDYKIQSKNTESSYYFPITYIYPMDARKKQLGNDIASDPESLETLEGFLSDAQPPVTPLNDKKLAQVLYPIHDEHQIVAFVRAIVNIPKIVHLALERNHDKTPPAVLSLNDSILQTGIVVGAGTLDSKSLVDETFKMGLQDWNLSLSAPVSVLSPTQEASIHQLWLLLMLNALFLKLIFLYLIRHNYYLRKQAFPYSESFAN